MTAQARIGTVLERYFGSALTPEELAAFDTVVLHGGQWLFRQGDAGDALYLLARGRLQAWLEASEEQPAKLLGEIAPGDSVGEMGLLSGQPRSAGVKAVRDSLLVRISRDQFDALAQVHPALVTRLAANLVSMISNPARGAASSQRPRTLAVVPLHGDARTRGFGAELAAELKGHGTTAALREDALGSRLAGGEISEELREWLHEQEDRHDLTIFLCRGPRGPWAELAQRQADLVLYVADAAADPAALSQLNTQRDHGARHALLLLQPGGDTRIEGTARWLDACPVDYHLHVRANVANDLARVARVISGKAIGLVLSAGAARGFAHLGVYRAMRENGIPVDWIGGSSIGSIMGAAMAADWDLERIDRTARSCFVDGKPFSDYTLPVTSLIRGRRMTRLLNQHLDLQIEDLPIPFFCVSAVLDDGSLNLHERGHVASALCATAALPGVIPPAVVSRRLSIDGSVLNSLPVDLMQKKPVGRIVAVDLSSDKAYEVDYPEVPSAWRVLAGRWLPFMKRYRVPALSTILLKATEIGTLGRMKELGARADLLLRPDVRGFGITEVKAFDRIVEAGYRCAMEELGALTKRLR